jgi:hypothetical protein
MEQETRVVGNTFDQRIRLSFDLLFALYTSALLVFLYESRPPYAWSPPTRYLYLWRPHAVSLRETDFVFFYLEVFLIPAVLIFVCVRLVERFSLTRPLLFIGGAVAIVGLPLVCMYGADRSPSFIILEPIVAVTVFLFWVRRRWPSSTAVGVLLLIIHHVFWFFFCVSVLGMARVDQPLASWGLWEYMVFVCPALGFSCCLLWAIYFRKMQATSSPRVSMVRS